MSLESKIAEMDSLEKIEFEMELDKKREKKREEQFKAEFSDCFRASSGDVKIEKLLAALDKRYQKKY